MLSILNVQPVIKTQRIISPIIDSSTKGNCSILSLVCVKGKKKAQCLNASKLFSFFFLPLMCGSRTLEFQKGAFCSSYRDPVLYRPAWAWNTKRPTYFFHHSFTAPPSLLLDSRQHIKLKESSICSL